MAREKCVWRVKTSLSVCNLGGGGVRVKVLFSVFQPLLVVARSGSAFEYWFNCLFLWQTHASQAVMLSPSSAGFVSTLLPLFDLRSVQQTFWTTYWCAYEWLVPPCSGVYTFKHGLFLQYITRYFHNPDLSHWSGTKIKCSIVSSERGRLEWLFVCHFKWALSHPSQWWF